MPYDLCIIGGGPAGLSAALNAASEGLEVVLIATRLGGQAGTSSLIENYPAFPEGISGPALTDRLRRQNLKFGVHILRCCVKLVRQNQQRNCWTIQTDIGTQLRARAVIIASGAHYNRLPAATPFEGMGVHYACTHQTVRRDCQCDEVAIIGGGNSAGQAAMFLSTKARHVHLIARRDLATTMSDYLLDRIVACDRISIHYGEIKTVRGNHDRICDVVVTSPNDPVSSKSLSITDLYIMIGAKPNTAYLHNLLPEGERHRLCNPKGFIITDVHYETVIPGLYAVGDVRLSSVKRVASASGEGAAVVPHVWQHLNQRREA